MSQVGFEWLANDGDLAYSSAMMTFHLHLKIGSLTYNNKVNKELRTSYISHEVVPRLTR